jgi:hypothetical protein
MSAGAIQIQANSATLASITLDSAEVAIDQLTGNAKSADPTVDSLVRNIKATLTAGTPSGGLAGDIMLVYT